MNQDDFHTQLFRFTNTHSTRRTSRLTRDAVEALFHKVLEMEKRIEFLEEEAGLPLYDGDDF